MTEVASLGGAPSLLSTI